MGSVLSPNEIENARAAMARDTCFALKQAIDPLFLSELHEKVVEFFELVNSDVSLEQMGEIIGLGAGRAVGHFQGARERGVCHHGIISQFIHGDENALIEAFARQLATPDLLAIFESMLGEDVFLTGWNLAIRYRRKDHAEYNLPFHQDSSLWKQPEIFENGDPLMLILWTPFVAVDSSVPGLEIVAKPVDETLPLSVSPETQFGHLEVGESSVLAKYYEQIWYPHLSPGDVAIFRDKTLHRSFPSPSSEQPRTSIDLRILSRRCYPRVMSKTNAVLLPSLESVIID